MAQTKHQIQELLARAGSQPRHRFGQNFMIDQKLLRERFAAEPRFTLIEGDALSSKHALSEALIVHLSGRKSKLVANLPYNIASPLIIELLIAGVEILAFTVQKEVADRLRAAPA